MRAALAAAALVSLLLLIALLWEPAPPPRTVPAPAPDPAGQGIVPPARNAVRDTPGAKPVAFESAALADLQPGDTFRFPVPERPQPLVGTVGERITHPNGDVSLVGHWANHMGSLVVTIGAAEAYATAAVDGRIWSLQATGDAAWAVAARALGGPTADDAEALPREQAPSNPPIR